MTERNLKVFEAHGVVFTGERGDQAIGLCPFTGKPEKFYINKKTLLWDSKTAGLSGNVSQFLYHISEQYKQDISIRHLERLGADRSLPVDAFDGWNIGWTGEAYSIPVRDSRGHVVDIRTYRIGKRGVFSSPGVQVGLLGAEHLPTRLDEDVYLCEGEWDAIALQWLMRKARKKGVVLAVPGAGTFKQDWAPWFQQRRVHVLYDADNAGEDGELVVRKRLHGVAAELTYVHWPEGVHDGFDVRDYVVYGAVERSKPKTCFASLERKFQPNPRKKPLDELDRRAGDPPAQTPQTKRLSDRPSNWQHRSPDFDDVVETFRKWLHLPSTIGIEATLATIVSQQIEGPPVWMFLVAPPGSAKTETLTAANGLPNVYLTSSLTPHALISGANWKGDQDPSLVPKLNGKIMIVKDFTSILSMRDADKDEIFGILRDAYDGRCGKVFGTGIERNYESRFTILAAVTPSIYALSSQHHSLGERFLKVTVGENLEHVEEREIIRRAINNINQDTNMKWELQDVVTSFITKRGLHRTIPSKQLPVIPHDLQETLISLGMFGARLRGTVSRDMFRNEIITARPSAEIGTRLGVQLAKLARSLALIHERDEVTEYEYGIVKKVMLDTVNQRTEDIVRVLKARCPTIDDMMTVQELSAVTRYPVATVTRVLQDLDVLNVVTRTGTTYKHKWTLSPYVREQIEKAGLYRTADELKPRGAKLTVKVRRKSR